MKGIKLVSILNFVFVLILLGVSLQTIGQTNSSLTASSILPNGKLVHGKTYVPSYNYLFGYSDYSPNNVLVINGVNVPLRCSGWYTDEGEHNPGNLNYVCGDIEGTYYRNFFAVDLTNLASFGITPPVTSAFLLIDRYSPDTFSGTLLFYLSEVTTPFELINQSYYAPSVAGQKIYSDLGKGNIMGTVMVDKAATGFVVVELNPQGLSAINNAIGSTFVLGGSTNIQPVPVPYWAIAVVFILIASFLIIRFRKRQLA
jgi:hypothetical protein